MPVVRQPDPIIRHLTTGRHLIIGPVPLRWSPGLDNVTEGGCGGWGASAGEFWHTEELRDGVNVNEFAEGTIYGRLFIYQVRRCHVIRKNRNKR